VNTISGVMVKAEKGGVLVLGLVLLSALLVLGLVSLNNMLFQQRIAGNFQQQLATRQATETGIHWATAWLTSRDETTRAQVDLAPPIPPMAENLELAWWRFTGFEPGTNPVSDEVLAQTLTDSGFTAHWVMELIHSEPAVLQPGVDISYYRILSRAAIEGVNEASSAPAVTESIVARPWGGEYEPGIFPPATSIPAGTPLFCDQFETNLPCGQVAWRQRK
jgi:hypothetical protein